MIVIITISKERVIIAMTNPDPTRRNLNIASVIFILYFLGDGSFNKNITIQAINITFENTGTIFIFAWIALFWFALRYWQTNRKQFNDDFKDDIHRLPFQTNSCMINYLEYYLTKQYKRKIKNKTDFKLIESVNNSNKIWLIPIQDSNSESHIRDIQIIGLRGFYLKIELIINAIIKKPAFTAYSAPYIVFYLAILSPFL